MRLFLALLFAVAAAATPVDFSGSWTLSLKESDNLDPLMELTGRNFFERKAAKTLSVTQIIEQTDDTLEVTVKSMMVTMKEVMKTDGSVVESKGRDGTPVTSTTSWEGNELVTHTTAKLKSGEIMPIVFARALSEDGQTMYQIIRYEWEGQAYELKRVFQRKE
ncbi:MAG: hypothetical protein HN348_20760 [Proteobacteria bacterium]|jgi:hypothetical protein|nr:hypothetical protein [Pseudomonadota bacterium]